MSIKNAALGKGPKTQQVLAKIKQERPAKSPRNEAGSKKHR